MEFRDILDAVAQSIQPIFDIADLGCNQRIEMNKALPMNEHVYLLQKPQQPLTRLKSVV